MKKRVRGLVAMAAAAGAVFGAFGMAGVLQMTGGETGSGEVTGTLTSGGTSEASARREPPARRAKRGKRGRQGPKGPPGKTGPRGLQGPQGPQGAQGNEGSQGETGPQGLVGPQGPAGITGLQTYSDDPITIPGVGFYWVEVPCPPGQLAISGGISANNPGGVYVQTSSPNPTDPGDWRVDYQTGGPDQITPWVVCANADPLPAGASGTGKGASHGRSKSPSSP